MMVEPDCLHVGSHGMQRGRFLKFFQVWYGLIPQDNCKAEAMMVGQTFQIYDLETPRRFELAVKVSHDPSRLLVLRIDRAADPRI